MVEKDKTLRVYTNREGRISSYTMPNHEVMADTSRYFMELPEHRRRDGEGPQGAHTTGQHGLGLARAPWW
jgi:hypothetical protein